MASNTNPIPDTKEDQIDVPRSHKSTVRKEDRPKVPSAPTQKQTKSKSKNDNVSSHSTHRNDGVIRTLQVENQELKEKLQMLQDQINKQKQQSKSENENGALSSIQKRWSSFKTATSSSFFSSVLEPSNETDPMVEMPSVSSKQNDSSLSHRRTVHAPNQRLSSKKKMKQTHQKKLPDKAKNSDDERDEIVAHMNNKSSRRRHSMPNCAEENTHSHEDIHFSDDSSCDEENVNLMSNSSKHESSTSQNVQSQGSFFAQIKDRGGWLVGLLILQSMSSFILEYNEKLLKKHIIIVNFLTMLVGAGGNAGNQASVRVIRGLAVGTLNDRTKRNFLINEFKMALSLSTILGVVGFIRALIFRTPVAETIAITSSLFMIVGISIGLGSLLPLGMKFCGIDPAHSSTTIQVLMDILGVTITCQVSRLVLKQGWLI